MKNPITTHVLDTARGYPAEGIEAVLEISEYSGDWKFLGKGTTNLDGRIDDLLAKGTKLSPGTYRLTFDVAPYLESKGDDSFYSSIPVVFTVSKTDAHYHVPLLLSPFGYSTYRGS